MILNPKKRRRKAFALALKIALSYYILHIKKKFISEEKYKVKLSDLHQKNALKVKETILVLNGLFIKVGQLISILSNVLPKTYGSLLESLQDNTPHSKFEVVKETIEKELNEEFDSIFESFDQNPIASASIGQVHKATLKTGEIVAVKIQHPYIKELAKVDLKIIDDLIKKLNKLYKVKGLDHAFEQVKLMIKEELDYSKEAQSMQTIKDNCLNIEGVYIPSVYSEYSSQIILTSSFCEGVKITNSTQLKEWDLNPTSIIERLVYTYCEMLLNQGIYHADPHPGNLMVNKKGQLIFLDFGAVGELTDEMRMNIPPFLQAIISEDDDKIMEYLQKMGFVGKNKREDPATKKIIEALTEFLQEGISMDNFNVENIKETSLFKLQKELSIKELTTSLEVPKDWILLERTLLLLYGICTTVAPEYKAMKTIRPYLKKIVFKNGGLKKIIIDTIKQQATTLFSLPKKVETYLTKANKGELKFTIDNLEENTNKMYVLGHQVIYSIVSVVFILSAMICNGYGLSKYETPFILLSIGFGILFFYSLLKNRKK